MKFIIDAQLPYVLCKFLNENKHDSIHAMDLRNKDFSTDKEICEYAQNEDRIVITKDYDFIDSHILKNNPEKLLWITTGNIKNIELIQLFKIYIEDLVKLFETYNFVEINNFEIKVHE
jgi:predicted nuclease of predicted toxin-antitoxin system